MATKDVQIIVPLLLLSSISVLSYLQFVVPGVTQAESSPIHYSETYPYWPNRTVDGNFSQNIKACLHTVLSGVTEAWLRIDLQTVRSIKFVKFWYRNDRDTDAQDTIRLRGYSIRVSNTANVTAGLANVCFTDDTLRNISTVIQENCTQLARYVWFYQLKIHYPYVPILEICEVQVFGCETGTYGINCSRTCNHCKNNETCDIDDGKCDNQGCAKPEYKPPNCFECKPEFHGPDCSLNCSIYCQGISCNSSSGKCLNGCEPGYQTPDCNMPCQDGHYGEKCAKTCGNCLNERKCDNVNGTCTDGCDAGFKGDFCKQAAVLMSTDEIARKDAVIIVTTTKFVIRSSEIVADVLMVIKMQNVMKVSYLMYHLVSHR